MEKESTRGRKKESQQRGEPKKKEGGGWGSHWQKELLMNTIMEPLEF